MSPRVNDHDMTVLVEAAAAGAVNARSLLFHGKPSWEELDAGQKNTVRETALPFIFHGTKALESIGYRKPRTITTEEELDALPNGSVVLSDVYKAHHGLAISFQRWEDGLWHRGARSGSTHPDNFLPVTVLHEPEPSGE